MCVGSQVVLLLNYVPELKLSNGSIGTVVDIVYENPDGPNDRESLPAYVIVDFPDAAIPEADKMFANHPHTCIPIEPFTSRCERNCCSCTTIPLRVSKAITIHKAQGMSVGEGHPWEKLVVGLPAKGTKAAPGLQQVAFSRATSRDAFAIADDEEITYHMLMSIGKSPASQSRRDHESDLLALYQSTRIPFLHKIKSHDPNTEQPSFSGGFNALIEWYRSRIAARQPHD
jgi:hypothetical protein